MKEKVSFLLDWVKVMFHENRVNIKTRNRIINRSKVFNYRWALDKLSLILVACFADNSFGIAIGECFLVLQNCRNGEIQTPEENKGTSLQSGLKRSFMQVVYPHGIIQKCWIQLLILENRTIQFFSKDCYFIKNFIFINIYFFNKILLLTRSFVTDWPYLV